MYVHVTKRISNIIKIYLLLGAFGAPNKHIKKTNEQLLMP